MNNQLKLCAYSTGKTSKLYRGHKNSKFCVNARFLRINQQVYIVAGGEDGIVCIYDAQSAELLQRLRGHSDSVLAVDCHPFKQITATASMGMDCKIHLWAV